MNYTMMHGLTNLNIYAESAKLLYILKMSYAFTATIFTKIMATERDYLEIFYKENLSDRSRHIQKSSINYFPILNKESISPNVFHKYYTSSTTF